MSCDKYDNFLYFIRKNFTKLYNSDVRDMFITMVQGVDDHDKLFAYLTNELDRIATYNLKQYLDFLIDIIRPNDYVKIIDSSIEWDYKNTILKAALAKNKEFKDSDVESWFWLNSSNLITLLQRGFRFSTDFAIALSDKTLLIDLVEHTDNAIDPNWWKFVIRDMVETHVIES